MDCIPSYVRNEKPEAAYHLLKSFDSFAKNFPNNHSFNIYQTKGIQLSNAKSIYVFYSFNIYQTQIWMETFLEKSPEFIIKDIYVSVKVIPR